MVEFLKNLVTTCRKAEAHTTSQFYKSQWQQSDRLNHYYVVYRVIIAFIFSALLIAAMTNVDGIYAQFAKFFIYLTHWGFILCTIQAILAATVVCRKYFELRDLESDDEKKEKLSTPSTLLDIYWIMYTMSVVCAFGITLIFWTRVYVPGYHDIGIMAFILHGVNTMIMLIDVVIVAHPLKFMHFLWTFGFVLVYLFFSYVYYLAGGTNNKNHRFIYHSLDWDRPEHALKFCVSSLVFGFFIHTIVWTFSVAVRRISGASKTNECLQFEHGLSQNKQHCISTL